MRSGVTPNARGRFGRSAVAPVVVTSRGIAFGVTHPITGPGGAIVGVISGVASNWGWGLKGSGGLSPLVVVIVGDVS